MRICLVTPFAWSQPHDVNDHVAGVAGSLEGPSSYLMKSPPRQIADDDAYELVEEFIERNRRPAHAPAPAEL